MRIKQYAAESGIQVYDMVDVLRVRIVSFSDSSAFSILIEVKDENGSIQTHALRSDRETHIMQ